MKIGSKQLNLSRFCEHSENATMANQKLIARLVLSERNVRRLNLFIKNVKRFRAAPCSTEGVPLRY